MLVLLTVVVVAAGAVWIIALSLARAAAAGDALSERPPDDRS
jgi:hypothetical protein